MECKFVETATSVNGTQPVRLTDSRWRRGRWWRNPAGRDDAHGKLNRVVAIVDASSPSIGHVYGAVIVWGVVVETVGRAAEGASVTDGVCVAVQRRFCPWRAATI